MKNKVKWEKMEQYSSLYIQSYLRYLYNKTIFGVFFVVA